MALTLTCTNALRSLMRADRDGSRVTRPALTALGRVVYGVQRVGRS